jgi:mannose-6-phosphate isomerase-like protein (cupin superfamily)
MTSDSQSRAELTARGIDPTSIAASLGELWFPKVIGELDDSYIKVAKLKGSLAWHSHDDEDELFFVLKGQLRIEMANSSVELGKGELFVVSRGTAHNPVAEEECLVLLVERKSTAHTGDVNTDKTRSIAEQLEPSVQDLAQSTIQSDSDTH